MLIVLILSMDHFCSNRSMYLLIQNCSGEENYEPLECLRKRYGVSCFFPEEFPLTFSPDSVTMRIKLALRGETFVSDWNSRAVLEDMVVSDRVEIRAYQVMIVPNSVIYKL